MARKKEKNNKPKTGFKRKVYTFADWTLLPLTEIKWLSRSFRVMGGFFKDAAKFSWALIRSNSESLTDSGFYRRVMKQSSRADFYNKLDNQSKAILVAGLSRSFLRKRLASVSFLFVVFILGCLFFALGLVSSDPSYFRMVVMFVMLLFFGGYIWISLIHYDNLRYFYELHDRSDDSNNLLLDEIRRIESKSNE